MGTDPLDTVIGVIQNENICETYNVGDTMEIDVGKYGKHSVKLVNCSSPESVCNNGDDYSETACGAVFEFTDILTTHRMSECASSVSEIREGICNRGGYPSTEMRTFLNDSTSGADSIYNELPPILRDEIITTRVVSGHSDFPEDIAHGNYTSYDKLYLLSKREIFGYTAASEDTAQWYTRQLDYYQSQGITKNSDHADIKTWSGYENGSPYMWWLRSSRNGDTAGFNIVYIDGTSDGVMDSTVPQSNMGVSPAFRLQ